MMHENPTSLHEIAPDMRTYKHDAATIHYITSESFFHSCTHHFRASESYIRVAFLLVSILMLLSSFNKLKWWLVGWIGPRVCMLFFACLFVKMVKILIYFHFFWFYLMLMWIKKNISYSSDDKKWKLILTKAQWWGEKDNWPTSAKQREWIEYAYGYEF